MRATIFSKRDSKTFAIIAAAFLILLCLVVNCTGLFKPNQSTEAQPLYTIVAISDMHIDYGIQNQSDVIREQNRLLLKTIRRNEKPDLMLVAGDTISTHGSGVWDKSTYDKVTSQVTSALKKSTRGGKVLYVSGNHDFEPGADIYNSGAYIDTANRAGLGEYNDVLYESHSKNLLAYHYEIDGRHFIGLNTARPDNGTISTYAYPDKEISWLKKVLSSLSREAEIFVLGHYPIKDSHGMTDGYGAANELAEVFRSYPNLIYIYGHDHANGFVERDTFERVTRYRTDGGAEGARDAKAAGFTSCFAGSLSYYKNRIDQDWLSETQPAVVQALTIYIYQDHVELQMKNYGEQTGEQETLESYTVPIKHFITSSACDINHDEGTITDIKHRTSIEDFLKKINQKEEAKIYGVDGTEITDHTKYVRSGMTIKRLVNGCVGEQLRIAVNQAAKSQSASNELVPSSAKDEMIACVDQKDNKIVVYKMNGTNWDDRRSLVWQWSPTAELGFSDPQKYINVSDAKLRYSNYYGGYVVLTVASGGYIAIVDYDTGESIYCREEFVENNPHSIELLPDGNLVVVSSTGNSVTIYATSQGDLNGYYSQEQFKGAHGVCWDEKHRIVWVLGDDEISGFEVLGTLENPVLKKRDDLVCELPTKDGEEALGHDLFPVYGATNLCWVTTKDNVYQFNTDTLAVTADYSEHSVVASANVKSIGNQPFSGSIVRATPDINLVPNWNTGRIDIFSRDDSSNWVESNRTHESETYYKARVWYPAYLGCA